MGAQILHCTRSIHTDFRYQFFHSLIHAEGGILTLILSHHSVMRGPYGAPRRFSAFSVSNPHGSERVELNDCLWLKNEPQTVTLPRPRTKGAQCQLF
ncbi:hypothetical protein AG1IA_07356 [Rhizoctonia solani AG-1 IA]|uniref:Uncharacterized protein n=1 Tax=Thanatephorus cucumeris (strain AG1-IA) TaxID=983506 RepID=L8WQK7_THACA|nr:hypothetical protein AG1IA_07356 [Rhizoctonia solani AG-1 IA]